VRVLGWQTPARSERKQQQRRCPAQPSAWRALLARQCRGRSTAGGTRKMVNYAWGGRSRRKLRWRPAAVLTCKSIVAPGH